MKKQQKFSTWLVDAAIQKERTLNEKRRKEMLERISKVLGKLSRSINFDEAYIFGSVTKKDRFRKNSDVDIGFVGLSGDDVIRAIALLSQWLGIDVDVIQMEGHRLVGNIQGGIKWKKEKKSY